jgi:hypothetical protein
MLRRTVFFWVLSCLLMLWGCATQPPVKMSGAMLVVRLTAKQVPTEAITVQVTQGDQTVPMASVNGLLSPRIGSRSIDYLFPVPLAPGRYKISAGSGLPSFELAFDVPAGAPVYVGRVLLSPDTAPALEDHQAEDVSMLRVTIDKLRSVAINTQLGSLRPERAPELARRSSKAGTLEVVPVAEVLPGELPVASRETFKRYLQLREPRAFAVNEDGTAYGVASGKNAIEHAMQDCNKLGPKTPCRLFSVNQTATLWRGCAAPPSDFKGWLRLADVAPQDAAAAANAACPPRR